MYKVTPAVPDSPNLRAHPRRRVCWIARQDSQAAEELFTLAAHPRRDWTPADWEVLLKELDKCKTLVAEWLRERGEPCTK